MYFYCFLVIMISNQITIFDCLIIKTNGVKFRILINHIFSLVYFWLKTHLWFCVKMWAPTRRIHHPISRVHHSLLGVASEPPRPDAYLQQKSCKKIYNYIVPLPILFVVLHFWRQMMSTFHGNFRIVAKSTSDYLVEIYESIWRHLLCRYHTGHG